MWAQNYAVFYYLSETVQFEEESIKLLSKITKDVVLIVQNKAFIGYFISNSWQHLFCF